jgi:hypothetical protein
MVMQRSDGLTYDEGQCILATIDGDEMAIATGRGTEKLRVWES